jgi:hypothetical protein
LASLKEKLSINNFSLPEECSNFVQLLQDSLKTIKEEYQKKQATLSAIKNQDVDMKHKFHHIKEK